MKKFFNRLFLFILPILIVVVLHGIFVPVHAVYFRNWEALRPKLFFNYYSGPFYPNMHVTMTEKGDLAPHTDLAVDKHVTWITDAYGFRTDDNAEAYNVVIVGDSNIAGSTLTQQDTLSEMLEKKIGTEVYPYAPETMEKFLADPRFAKNPPKVVILSSVERGMHPLDTTPAVKVSPVKSHIESISPLTSLVTLLDTTFDLVQIKYIGRKILDKPNPSAYTYASGTELFLQGEATNADIPEVVIKQSADIIEGYSNIFNEKGIHMIFLPIPNKENIYYKMLPSQKKPVFLKKIITELNRRGVDIVDLQTVFENAYENRGLKLYHTDDSHWNAAAVRITTNEIAKKLTPYLTKP